MRAIGTPDCRICTVLSTAAWTEGKEQMADTMDSGMPYRRSVVLVMMPKVPSDPTNRLVRLYPADVFLKTEQDGHLS